MRVNDFDFDTAFALRMAIYGRISVLEGLVEKDPEVYGSEQIADWNRQLANLRKVL